MPRHHQRPPLASTLLVGIVLSAADAATLPVREVTVFKDGHALLLHEGEAPVDERGLITLDHLPEPLMGTFWAWSTDAAHPIRSVTTGRHDRTQSRAVVSLAELVRANPGVAATITDQQGATHSGRIELLPGDPAAGAFFFLHTDSGRRTIAWDQLRNVSFEADIDTSCAMTVSRPFMNLDLDWGPREAPPSASVGCMYVQEGLRWIPSYRVELTDRGTATLQLQATLVNDMLDVHDITLNLVIGVPSFALADMLDPISLQETITSLAPVMPAFNRTANALSNALASQAALQDYGVAAAAVAAPAPDTAPGESADELYVFTVEHISLARGQRMIIPITTIELPFQDIFRLELPPTVPPDVYASLGAHQYSELEQALRTPQVRHVIRLSNTSSIPITTAPALIMRDGRILAQAMTRYAAPGISTDLEVTRAMDMPNTVQDRILARDPRALEDEAGRWFTRIDVRSEIRVTNRRETPVRLEVTRDVTGRILAAPHGGDAVDLSMTDPRARRHFDAGAPWWAWYSWPWWWHRYNGLGRFTWLRDLAPGETATFAADWCYYWL